MNTSKVSLINAAAEKQIFTLRGTSSDINRSCRKGCVRDEMAYYAVPRCQRSNTNAPDGVQRGLHFDKVALNINYNFGNGGQSKIRVRQSTEVPLYHNKLDVMVQTRDKIYLFEVSVPHLQNYHIQKGIKRTKYAKNSCDDISHRNFKTVGRDTNLVDVLKSKHKSHVKLGLLVVGCFSEIINTEEHKNLYWLLEEFGAQQHSIRTMIRKAWYSVVSQTCNILRQLIGKEVSRV